MTGLTFIILALAVYRLTVLLSRDSGPGNVFRDARIGSSFLKCPFCTSVWMGVLVALAYRLFPQPTILTASALAFSAIAIALDRTFTADHLS